MTGDVVEVEATAAEFTLAYLRFLRDRAVREQRGHTIEAACAALESIGAIATGSPLEAAALAFASKRHVDAVVAWAVVGAALDGVLGGASAS
jgi:hypothetical protein